jgi:hypothetical protein
VVGLTHKTRRGRSQAEAGGGSGGVPDDSPALRATLRRMGARGRLAGRRRLTVVLPLRRAGTPAVLARVPREGAVDLDLADKIAVVTGAGRRIGLAVSTALAEQRVQVAAAARSTERLEGPSNVTPVASDLSMPAEVATRVTVLASEQPTSPIQTGGLRWSRVQAHG